MDAVTFVTLTLKGLPSTLSSPFTELYTVVGTYSDQRIHLSYSTVHTPRLWPAGSPSRVALCVPRRFVHD